MVVVSAMLALVLAGCVSSAKPEPSPSGPTSIPGLPVGAVPAESIPTDVPNDANARTNVTMNSCNSIKGGWSAAGTVTNPGPKTVEYTITVFFTTTAATVIDSAQSKVSVAAGSKKNWNASKKFGAAAKMLCVLRGVG
jgi:hypothetical protein